MTKKQVIQEALDFAWSKSATERQREGIAWLAANHSYELGRIAGLREAESMLNNFAAEVFENGEPGLPRDLGIAALDIRKHADKLAKKARAK